MERFRQIYEENVNEVYRFLLSLCRDEHLAEELTQETFVRALDRIDTFRGDCKISVWLCQIAKHLFYRHYKRNRNMIDFEAEQIDRITQAESPEGEFLLQAESQEIMQWVHKLEEPYKDVFMLHIFGGISLKEISLLYGKSDSWARVTYYRAKATIIGNLKGETT